MSVDKLVDSIVLDSDLGNIANAIRTKGGTNLPLAFPSDFISAINALPVFHSYNGNVVNFTTVSPTTLLKLNIEFEPVQSGSGDPSPNNQRPISGWNAVNIWVQPTHDTTANPTATINLNGTRYGGTLDVATSILTIDRVHATLNGTHTIQLINWRATATSVGWAYSLATFPNRKTLATTDTVGNILSDKLKTGSYNNAFRGDYDAMISGSSLPAYSFFIRYPDTSLTTVSAVNTFLSNNPIDIVYEVENPFIIKLPPVTVSTLIGANNIWADTGNITLWYVE